MANESGQGVRWRVTLDPEDLTAFTDIDQMIGDIAWSFTNPTSKVTPHSRGGVKVTADEYIVSPEIVRDEMTFEVNFDKNDVDHIALRDLALSRAYVGVEKVGPDGVPYDPITPANTKDSILQYGWFSGWTLMDPQGENSRKATWKFRPTGSFRIDGQERV